MQEKIQERAEEKGQTPVVRFDHVSMQFPGVLASDDVSLEIRQGEVFALVGENGAGKSTLMNLLYGIHTPTAGEIYVKGKKLVRHEPSESIEAGIGMVHQHFMLVPSFTVAQNIVLSREPRKLGIFCDLKKAEEETRQLVEEYGLKVDPKAVVGEISVGLQQRVEILKTLHRGAEILILDEPTAVLTPQETDELFAVIRRIVREKNMTVIIITHKLYEVMAISDRVGVMRQGKLIGVEETKNVSERILASMMVGREVLLDQLEKTGKPGQVLIDVRDVHADDNRGLPAVNGVSLQVRAGEILGIAAIEGNGQSELLEVITGMRPLRQGQVFIAGQNASGKDPGQIRAMGLAHIPEDRIATGVSSQSSVKENLIIGKERQPDFAKKGIHLRQSSIARYASDLFAKYDLRGAGIETEAGSLSGGNMQKVVVAREFSFDTPILVIAQPTRGVDIGAMEFIHQQIIRKRNEGCAILLVSADLDEVLRLSDRVITMYEGRVTGEFPAEKIDRMEIGYYMTGSRKEEVGGESVYEEDTENTEEK
ncbi:MAG: ABC transporter ATP-binding protein [Anaerovoracaceae bacterium]|nr:ABC transporter ATP-binding protein [Anaerovoracaceae bacterium]